MPVIDKNIVLFCCRRFKPLCASPEHLASMMYKGRISTCYFKGVTYMHVRT